MFAFKRMLLSVGIVLSTGALARATTVNPPEFPALVNEADYIVRAVVKSVRAEMEQTATGRKIHTFVELDVLEVIAGTPPSPLVLRLLGGKVGDEEMVLQGAPRFNIGDEDILFIRGNGLMAYPLVGIMHGRYPIKHEDGTNRRYMARSNGAPVRNIAEVASPMTDGAVISQPMARSIAQALSPDQFIQQIKEVSNSPKKRDSKN